MEKQKYLYLALCLLGLSQSVFGFEEIVELGEGNVIKGESLAIGRNNEIIDYEHGLGDRVNGSIALGLDNQVFGHRSYAIGEDNYVSLKRTHYTRENMAVGMVNKIVEGVNNYVFGQYNEVGRGYRTSSVGFKNEIGEAIDSSVFGNGNRLNGQNSFVYGNGNIVSGEDGSVIGKYNYSRNRNVVIGNGYMNTGEESGVWGFGQEFRERPFEGEHDYGNEGDASYMIGNQNKIAAGTSDNFILGNSVSIGEGINNSVALGTGSTVSASNEVSVGSAGKERKITNVAEGTISSTSTDAVNGSQLYEISRKIEGQEQDYKKVKSEMRGIASLSAALAGLHPMQYDPYAPSQVMAAVGSYREKQAIAVGLSHYFTSNVMMSAGVALSDEKRTSTMANLGVTWKFGKGGSQASVENPQIMKSEMQRLARENQAFQAKIGSLESKVQELETALQSLLKK
ncbi:YadA family autotransporter adhesin [Fusobacterium necrophorum]|uniref:YadA family autotransporter adhesin n=1 Tax=Fusobacterium necrophorum TaxID=859 RepID=UPI003FA09EDF